MSPAALNAVLPEPYPGLVVEQPGAGQRVSLGRRAISACRSAAPGALRMDLTACTGAGKHVVFLFNPNGLFRLSYRLAADTDLP